MSCDEIRLSYSALLDGEHGPCDEATIQRHLAMCPDCRAWCATTQALVPTLRVGAVGGVPDLAVPIAAAVVDDRRQRALWWRIPLAVVALCELLLSVPSLVPPQSTHTDHELAAWSVALALAFGYVVLRPERAGGLLPFVTILVALSLGVAAYDVLRQDAGSLTETAHVFEAVGLFLLWGLARQPQGPPEAPVERPRLTVA